MGELTDYVNNITLTLEKGKYAFDGKAAAGSVQQAAAGNRLCQGRFEPTSRRRYRTVRHLQIPVPAGSFCASLSNRVSEGGTITEEELALMDQLTGYAAQISGHLSSMESALDNGELTFAELTQSVQASSEAEAVSSGLDNGFREMEEGFEDYPTLIYDGPFSDHILQQSPRLTEGQDVLSAETALEKAKAFTGNDSLTLAEETGGNLPCYRFEADTLTISITQAGGYTDYFYNSREMGEATLTG